VEGIGHSVYVHVGLYCTYMNGPTIGYIIMTSVLFSGRTRGNVVHTPLLPRLCLLVYFIWTLHGYAIRMWLCVRES